MSRIKLDPSLEKLFSVSENGFRLEDRHFYKSFMREPNPFRVGISEPN